MARPIVIHADWDPDAGVWVATTQDMRGLVTEAETMEALRAKLPAMILDLLEENGIFGSAGLDRDRCARQRSIDCSRIVAASG